MNARDSSRMAFSPMVPQPRHRRHQSHAQRPGAPETRRSIWPCVSARTPEGSVTDRHATPSAIGLGDFLPSNDPAARRWRG